MALAATAAWSGCVEGDADAAPVHTDLVVIPGPWVFEPAVAAVAPGTTVTFVNRGGADHTVTFEDSDFDVVVPPGGQVTRTFETEGRFAYICKYHPPDMRGVITVSQAAPG